MSRLFAIAVLVLLAASPRPLQAVAGGFSPPTTLVSPPMGSSGSKKTRKGKPRQHLAKVGTPAENAHTMHAAERDVIGNFGIHGKGWVFWVAVVVIVLIGIGGIVSLALL